MKALAKADPAGDFRGEGANLTGVRIFCKCLGRVKDMLAPSFSVQRAITFYAPPRRGSAPGPRSKAVPGAAYAPHKHRLKPSLPTEKSKIFKMLFRGTKLSHTYGATEDTQRPPEKKSLVPPMFPIIIA